MVLGHTLKPIVWYAKTYTRFPFGVNNALDLEDLENTEELGHIHPYLEQAWLNFLWCVNSTYMSYKHISLNTVTEILTSV